MRARKEHNTHTRPKRPFLSPVTSFLPSDGTSVHKKIETRLKRKLQGIAKIQWTKEEKQAQIHSDTNIISR